MSDKLHLAYQTIDEQHSGDSAVTRRKLGRRGRAARGGTAAAAKPSESRRKDRRRTPQVHDAEVVPSASQADRSGDGSTHHGSIESIAPG